MLRPFAHTAVVRMQSDQDIRALGGAITLALCGDWDHAPPCPLAPHATGARRRRDLVLLRTLFATEPAHEREVRDLIDRALAAGRSTDPAGREWRWRLRQSRPSRVRVHELEHARRLASSG